MADTKMCTGLVRFSFVNVFEPRKNDDGSDGKRSCTLLIPKSDTKTLANIKAAQMEARENFCRKNGPASLPAKPNSTLHDGDGVKDNGEPYGPECHGHYVISVSSKDPVKVLDASNQPITDRSQLYSGCYGQAVINFYGYSRNGKKGISAGLLGIRKIRDGEPLGGGTCRDADFDDSLVSDALGADDDWLS